MKIIISICIGLLSITNWSFAQTSPDLKYNYNNTFKVSVTQFLASEYRGTYEHYFSKHRVSIALSAAYVLNKKSKIGNNRSLEGFGGNLQLKRHLFNKYGSISLNKSETSIIDIYYAPYVQYFKLKYVQDDFRYYLVGFPVDLYGQKKTFINVINAYETGIMFGVELSIFQRFIMEIYTGAGYRNAIIDSSPYNYTIVKTEYWARGFTGVVPRIGINFGFTF